MKNKNLIYCLIGSFILSLLNSTFLNHAVFNLFPGGYAMSKFGIFLISTINILSFIGFLLLIIFSLILVVKNIIEFFKNELHIK